MVPKSNRYPEGQGLAQTMNLRERLAAIAYTGAISDILDEMGLREQVLPHEIRPIRPGQTVVGRALTVLGEPAAGLARDDYFVPFLKMLGSIEAGDVPMTRPGSRVEDSFSGVWPPKATITPATSPLACSASRTFCTSSRVTGSK